MLELYPRARGKLLEVFGLGTDAWTAIGSMATAALAGLTCFLVLVGLFQITSAKKENRILLTVSACDRYDTDPVIDSCLRNLSAARRSGQLQATPSHYKADFVTVLNYLESLAIGIEEGLYIEGIVHDHNAPIVKQHVEQYLIGTLPAVYGLVPDDYKWLYPLYVKWFPSVATAAPKPKFRDGWFKRR